MSRFVYPLILIFASLAPAVALSETVVSMKAGERLIGEISDKSDKATLVLVSPLLGELRLPRAQIASIDTSPGEKDPEVARKTAAAKPQPAPEPPKKAAPRQAPKAVAQDPAPEPSPEKPIAELILEKARDLKAPKSWKGNLRFGINMSTGDRQWTETFTRGSLIIDPEKSKNFYRFNGSYTFRETVRGNGAEVVSTDRYDANFTYRRDISAQWFLQNSLAGRVDQVKGIDRELQELVGIGYRLKPSKKFELLFGGGGGIEDFQSNSNTARNDLNAVANIFQEFTWRPFDRARVDQEFNYFVNPDDENQYNYLLRFSFRYRITDLFGVEFSFRKNFDNDVAGNNQEDDTQWRNALIVYF